MFERNEQLEERLNGLFVQATRFEDRVAMDEFLSLALPALTNRVTRWCDKRGKSWKLAEAIACGSLMKALRAADRFDPEKCGGKVMVWLVAIARREFIDCIRFMERGDCESLDLKLIRPIQGKNARDEDKRDAARLVAGVNPIEELIRREEQESLDAAIPSLPELKRRVIELYRSGKTPGLIAVELRLRPTRVYKLLFDAKQELRRRIA